MTSLYIPTAAEPDERDNHNPIIATRKLAPRLAPVTFDFLVSFFSLYLSLSLFKIIYLIEYSSLTWSQAFRQNSPRSNYVIASSYCYKVIILSILMNKMGKFNYEFCKRSTSKEEQVYTLS